MFKINFFKSINIYILHFEHVWASGKTSVPLFYFIIVILKSLNPLKGGPYEPVK